MLTQSIICLPGCFLHLSLLPEIVALLIHLSALIVPFLFHDRRVTKEMALVAIPPWLIPFSQPPGPSVSLSSLRFRPVLLKSPQVLVQLGSDWLGAVQVKSIHPKVLGAPDHSNKSKGGAQIQDGFCGPLDLL